MKPMRYLLLLALFALGLALWGSLSVGDRVPDNVELPPNRPAGIQASEGLAEPHSLFAGSSRRAVDAREDATAPEPPHHPEDLVRIQKLEEEIAALAAERETLRGQVASLQLAVLREQCPEATPVGAFLHSAEAETISDQKIRIHVKEWLDVFPVFLRPGEATWIAERLRNKDWLEFGRTSEVALIYFLGISRLEAELPEERLRELREDYEEEGIFD